MASPHGIAAQLGYVSESVVGTPVTVTKFLPFRSENIQRSAGTLDSTGLRAGRFTTAKWKQGAQGFTGTIDLELWNVDVATLWKHCFGTVNTTGAGPYTHTLSPGDLTGKSMTIQVGRPDIAGTVQPFTWSGCKVNSWTVAANVGEIASQSLDIVAMTETTGTALATASYTSTGSPFVFTEASVTVGGSAVNTVKSASLTGNNALTDRFRLGASTSREPLGNGMREYTGQIEADFESLAHYNRIVNGTEAAVVYTFNNGTQTLTITMNARFDAASPNVAGAELLNQPLSFKCVSGTSDAAAITAVLVNTDTSAA